MEQLGVNELAIYQNLRARTKGEIYIGVVGPVRTGKSTFIRKFMEYCVLPYMEDPYEKQRTMDELPQSAEGRTITTTEPKFVPKEAATVWLDRETNVGIRLVDCVGYMADGAQGHMEEDRERMVKTPWSDTPIPFTMAAGIGTDKVIEEHSTIGIVMTSDGSFGDLRREAFIAPEQKAVAALKHIGKPFIMIVNSSRPKSEETQKLVEELQEKYNIKIIATDCTQLGKIQMLEILSDILLEFPVKTVDFYLPEWVAYMNEDHEVRNVVRMLAMDYMEHVTSLRSLKELENSVATEPARTDFSEYGSVHHKKTDPSVGKVEFEIDVDRKYYFEMLTSMVGEEITDDGCLLEKLRQVTGERKLLKGCREAMEEVTGTGYGVIMPGRDEIVLSQPELIKSGSKFGIKILAKCPSVHLIKAGIETEIAPIVGTEEQAKDLLGFLEQAGNSEEGIWDTNIFGKTVSQLVFDGINSKISSIDGESREKLQETMQKIVNDSNGGLVCIIV